MPVIRINKTKDYTVMSNTHLKDKALSLKAKGLLSLMLSLPDTWIYSIEGLTAICKEGETSVRGTLNELKKNKYLIVTRNRNKQGEFEYVYDIYEKPYGGFPHMDNPHMDKPDVENQALLNTNNKKTKNKEKINKKKNTNYENYKQREYTEEELQGLYSNI